MLAPPCARARVIALPMPLLPPVTMATLPLTVMWTVPFVGTQGSRAFAAQHRDGAGPDDGRITRLQIGGTIGRRRVVGVELEPPHVGRRQLGGDEGQRLPPAVDEHEEVVVDERRAVLGVVGRVVAVEI